MCLMISRHPIYRQSISSSASDVYESQILKMHLNACGWGLCWGKVGVLWGDLGLCWGDVCMLCGCNMYTCCDLLDCWSMCI